jgi:transketolase N-terminal domain/subunit
MVSQDLIQRLQRNALELREFIVSDLIGVGKVGHLGGSCSCAEIVATLYFHKMPHDPKTPALKDRDRFLLRGRRKATARASLLRCDKIAQSRFLDNGHSGPQRSPGRNPHFLQHSTSNGDGIQRAPSSSAQGH